MVGLFIIKNVAGKVSIQDVSENIPEVLKRLEEEKECKRIPINPEKLDKILKKIGRKSL